MKNIIIVLILCYTANLIMIPIGISLLDRCIVCGLIGLFGGLYGTKEL